MIDEKKLIEDLKESGLIVDNEYGNVLVEFIENQPKVGEWILCSEQLPDESGDYLVTIESDDHVCLDIEEIDCDGFLKRWNYIDSVKVIAWMPLPAQYVEN